MEQNQDQTNSTANSSYSATGNNNRGGNPNPSQPKQSKTLYIVIGILVIVLIGVAAYVKPILDRNAEEKKLAEYMSEEVDDEIREVSSATSSAYASKPTPNMVAAQTHTLYTFSEVTNMRSGRESGSTSNIIQRLEYGTQLTYVDTWNEWTEVKYGNAKGYIASFYALPENEFILLNSILSNKNARLAVKTAESKRALIKYFIENEMFGDPANGLPQEYKNYSRNWVVDSKAPSQTPNAVYYTQLYNTKSTHPQFAVMLSNKKTKEYKLVVFGFDNNTGQAWVISQENADHTYFESIMLDEDGDIEAVY